MSSSCRHDKSMTPLQSIVLPVEEDHELEMNPQAVQEVLAHLQSFRANMKRSRRFHNLNLNEHAVDCFRRRAALELNHVMSSESPPLTNTPSRWTIQSSESSST